MTYSHEVEHMCVVKKGPNHGPAPIPEEGKWVKSKEIKDISGLTHGIGWCAPQQGACKRTLAKGPRYLEMAEGYIKTIALDENDEICGYEFVHLGKFMDEIKKGTDANEALKKVTGTYGRFTAEQGAVKHIDPRHE